MSLFEKLCLDDSGVTVIEYGIIAGLLAIAAVVAMTDVGSSLNTMYESVKNAYMN